MALIHQCMAKGTRREGDQLRRSINWVFAKRGILQVKDSGLSMGSWDLPYDSIREAILFSIRSPLFIPGYVLMVRTDEATYQFGLNPGRFWKGDLPFPVTREKGRLGYSWFSIVARIVLVILLAEWAWRRFGPP